MHYYCVSLNGYKAVKVNLQIEKNSAEKTSEISALREELDACKDQLNDSELQLRDLAEEYDSKVRYLLVYIYPGFLTCHVQINPDTMTCSTFPNTRKLLD